MKRKRQHAPKGIALIIAMYVTVILLALGTFFIADQIDKSKTVIDYKDSELALQGANAGLNLMVNYLGNVENDWSDAMLLRNPSSGSTICGSTPAFLYANSYHIQFGYGSNNVQLFSQSQGSTLFESDYPFEITDPIEVSPEGDRVATITGTLKLFTVSSESCGSPSDTNPSDLVSVEVDVTSQISNGVETGGTLSAGNVVYAARSVQWTGSRHPLLESLYQCWSCWDAAGNKYPNSTDGTDNAAFVGNGYTTDSSTGDLGQQATTETPDTPYSSPYGALQDGILNVQNNGGPPAAQFNGEILADGNVNGCGGCDVKTGESVPLPTGSPFGAAEDGSGNFTGNTAASAMAQEYISAASDQGCSGTVKSVFVDSSEDVGPGTPGGTPHDIEIPPSGSGDEKPGEAITDITLNPPTTQNPNGTITIDQIGYYSGSILNSETFSPTQLQNGVIYVQGGNVRVHGDLGGSGLTVVANQGEGFFNANGVDITSSLASQTGTSCIAADPNNNDQPYAITTAERYSSDAGGPTSQGVDYWIPNACNPCTPSNFTLTNGIYTNSSGATVGYHVDDVNGQPLVSSSSSFGTVSCADSGCSATPPASVTSGQTIYAPAPTFNAQGQIINPNSTAGLSPNSYVMDTTDYPNTVSVITPYQYGTSNQYVWPYPGASALNQLDASGSTTDDHLIYTRQFEDSEGNLTISGDTMFSGLSTGLGLVAQNFILLDDFTAGDTTGSLPGTKDSTGIDDFNFDVRADLLSVNQSVQWEGNTVTDPNFPSDPYTDGDYTAMNGEYGNGTTYDYSYTYNGVTHTVEANSWQGAPLTPPSQFAGDVSALTQEPGGGKYWSFNLEGASLAPYQDVVGTTDGSGNPVAYSTETIYSDQGDNPRGFPFWNFTAWRQANLVAVYQTISYIDLGALGTSAGQ